MRLCFWFMEYPVINALSESCCVKKWVDDDCEIAVFLTDSFLKSLRLLTKAKTLLYLLIYIVEN